MERFGKVLAFILIKTKTMKKLFWTIVAILSGLYIFIPEFTDVIPIIGWLDEATALVVLNYALKQLDIKLFEKFFGGNKKTDKTLIINQDK